MVKDDFFQNYSRKHLHFYNEEVPVLLSSGLALARKSVEKPRIVDLGCGDGRMIFALRKRGLLENGDEVFGVDISEERIERVKKELPFVKSIVSDALNVEELEKSSFDFVICSQLIEHVERDGSLMSEIRRLLRTGGLAYISSVIKKAYGVYFYFRNGHFRLDPTHLKEYSSAREFTDLIARKDFEITKIRTQQIEFSVIDLFVQLLTRTRLAKISIRFYQRYRDLYKLRLLCMPVFGYSEIEVLVKKK